jgi:hypothetical protein
VASHVEQTVAVDLVSHWRTTIRFVRDSTAPLTSLELSLKRRGRAANAEFDRSTYEMPLADGAPQEHALDEGRWVAHVHSLSIGSVAQPIERSQRLVGFRAFEVGETHEEVVEIELVAACALELPLAVVDAELETSQPKTVERLRVFSDHGESGPQPIAPDATTITFEDLLPDTEYTIQPLGRNFRTGAPGSVTRIDS